MKKSLFALAVCSFLGFTSFANAEMLSIAPGESKTIHLEAPYKSSANTDKAVVMTTGRGSSNVTIKGLKAGNSEIKLYSRNGKLLGEYEVQVGGETAAAAPVEQQAMPQQEQMAQIQQEAVQLNAVEPAAGTKTKKRKVTSLKPVPVNTGDLPETRRVLKSLFPGDDIRLERVENSIVISGSASDAETAARVVQLVQQVNVGSNVINMLEVKGGQQVMLRVQIGEVQRGALKDLGLSVQGVKGAVTSLFYSSKMFDTSTKLDHLTRNGLMKVLAEPNLTAISGEKAKFLAGGEFPVTVPQKGEEVFTVQYKPFGVGIEFTPYVLSENRIRLEVEPEVSEVSGTTGPAKMPVMSTRRAKTTIELAPGESYMIAGLIRDDSRTVVDEMPALADVPVLGALFRSSAFKSNQTELVIAVTPYLVDPVRGADIKLPTDDFKPASALETYFFGSLGGVVGKPANFWGSDKTAPQAEGKHGFMTH